MNIYTPYTYLIGWSDQQKYYYGVRYKNNCNPSDLWVTYFTSSKHVKIFREHYGEPDIIEIRKTFVDKKTALLWEQKVLKKLKIKTNNKWLNVAIGMPSFEKRKHSEEYKKHMSEIMKNRDAYWMKNKKRPEHSLCISNKMWITNGFEEKYIDKTENIPIGFRKGRKAFDQQWKSKIGGDKKSKNYKAKLSSIASASIEQINLNMC